MPTQALRLLVWSQLLFEWVFLVDKAFGVGCRLGESPAKEKRTEMDQSSLSEISVTLITRSFLFFHILYNPAGYDHHFLGSGDPENVPMFFSFFSLEGRKFRPSIM